MRRVILGEFKKVFKSKINIILLLLLFLFSGYINYHTYHNSAMTSEYYPEITENGKVLNTLQLYQKMDRELEQKSGKVSDVDYEKYYEEYEKKAQETLKNDAYDIEKIKEMYGDDYQEVIDKTESKAVSDEDIEKFCKRNCSYRQDKDGNFQFDLAYKNDGQRLYLNLLYFGYNGTEIIPDEYEMKASFSNPFYALTNIDELKYPKGSQTGYLFYMDDKEEDDDIKQVAQMLSQKLDNHELTFHSTIANNLFLENIHTTVSVFALIVIAIVIANIFANEAYNKTDQIIIPTKTGSLKLTIAKIICALSIGISSIVAIWLISLLAALIYLPIHDLNTVVMDLGGTYSQAMNYVFTYKEIILNGILISFMSVIATVLITLGLSYFTKNRFATIIIIFLLLLVPMIIPFNYLLNLPGIDYIFPGKAMSFMNYFVFNHSGLGSPYLIFNGSPIWLLSIAVIIFAVISAVIGGTMIVHSRKHIVNNR